MRVFEVSATYTAPLLTATPCGLLNWPLPEPNPPKAPTGPNAAPAEAGTAIAASAPAASSAVAVRRISRNPS